MTKQELSAILANMVKKAKKGTITTQYHLFGIKYAIEINNATFTADDISEDAGLSRKYGIEIRKGIRLAQHVNLK
jgi:hypothetical protein